MNGSIFLKSAIQQFKDYKSLADRTFAQLEDKDFYYSPDVANNSIAVNITHLYGNMLSRWTNFLTEDGEKEWRKRDAEFDPEHFSHEQLLQRWEEGWQVLFHALESLTPADLEKTIYIRTKPLSVIEAIHRQLTHYASHVGQIIFLGKNLKGKNWKSLSIPAKKSQAFNEEMKKN